MSEYGNGNDNEPIILTEKYARAVVGYCLTNKSFLRTCSDNVKPIHLATFPIVSSLYEIVIHAFKTVDKQPKKEDIIQSLLVKFPVKKDFDRYLSELDSCINAKSDVSFEHLRVQLSGWLKMIKTKTYIKTAADLFMKGKYSDVDRYISDQSRKVLNTEFESDERVEMKDASVTTGEFFTNKENCCTLGHPMFDELLMDGAALPGWGNKGIKEATTGSLMPGDLTVFLGPSNSGKTTTMATIIGHNLYFGKEILVITHEERKEKIKLKFLQSFTQLKMDELGLLHSPTVEQKTKDLISNKIAAFEMVADKQLYYYEWIKPGRMFVEDVLDHIQNVWDKKVDKTGKGFDLIVCDYPGKLRSRTVSSKNPWDEKTYVYDQFLQLARSYRTHVITPAQTNRQGYRVNKGEEGRMIDQGDMADAYGISQLADNIITINRTPEDIAKGIVKFHISKSRQSANGTTFVSKTDFYRAMTHGVGLAFVCINPEKENKAAGVIKDGSQEAIDMMLGMASRGQIAMAASDDTMPMNTKQPTKPTLVQPPKPTDILKTSGPAGNWDSLIFPTDNKNDDNDEE